ncbi:MAG: transposase [Methanobrevibacter sp.]|nr:transposase [Candidatus Methanoflexus mossambicus]
MSSELVNGLFVPDEKKAIDIFRSIRWSNGVYCPK